MSHNEVTHCRPSFWLRSRSGWFSVEWRESATRTSSSRALHTRDHAIALERAEQLLAAPQQTRQALLAEWFRTTLEKRFGPSPLSGVTTPIHEAR
jgi:hypothetical protein